MALNRPTCKTPLERNGETAHCATCDKDFTVRALCPECHQPLQVLKLVVLWIISANMGTV